MPMDEEKRMSKGFAFVEFHTPEVGRSGAPTPAQRPLANLPSFFDCMLHTAALVLLFPR